jgi:hypothetical protein
MFIQKLKIKTKNQITKVQPSAGPKAQLIETLPYFSYMAKIEYHNLDKQF